jgi:hypothetical protein
MEDMGSERFINEQKKTEQKRSPVFSGYPYRCGLFPLIERPWGRNCGM